MWKTNSADRLGAMHHIFLRCGLSAFFSVCRTVSCESVSTCCSSTMRPASRRSVQRPRSTGGAGQRDQLGFLLAIELALVQPLADPVRAESGLQALQDEALPQALQGRDANIQRRNDPI